jgi:hypothetical protein
MRCLSNWGTAKSSFSSTGYKSNSHRGFADRNADDLKILYFYRAIVEAATGFIC